MMPAQVPASRLRLKRSSGWFAAGLEVATALPLLSDAAFKLYIFLCLNVDRHSARMVWEPMELATLLHRDCPSVTDSLQELCRRGVCIRRPAAAGRFTTDRLSVEICDRFWPYEKPPVEEFGIDQDHYVQRVRQMLLRPACVRSNFSGADERLAALLYRRGVTLVHLQRAICLGCARKYASLLNADEYSPRLISSLHYFSVLVEEVSDSPAGEGYWKHVEHKAFQLERMWMERAAASRQLEPGDEMTETK
jgi:hypothetical protein